jgi:AcrR family transcriptional regulator
MARRSEHSREELHAMVLEAAERIVVAEGYRGLNARKVAAAIGYTVGTLYLVFENLDDLALQVNARTLDALYARMVAQLEDCHSAPDCLQRLGQAYVRFATEHANRWSMIYELSLASDHTLPDYYRDKVQRALSLVEQALTPLMNGKPRSEIAQAARALWGGVHGICILALTNRLDVAGTESVEALSTILVRNFVAGLTQG